MFFRKRRALYQTKSVLPQSIKIKPESNSQSGRISPCTLQKLKGSLTIETSMILPFFLLMLLGFFSLFQRFSETAALQMELAAQAETIGTARGIYGSAEGGGEIYLQGSRKINYPVNMPFLMGGAIHGRAVCRAWIGFTTLEQEEIYVYITPGGSVYHLSSACSHLDLSVREAACGQMEYLRNEYGNRYRACELCTKENVPEIVYITEEGDCYHSRRACSGLKRDIKCVPLSEVSGRSCCIRCSERGEPL